MKNYGSTVGAAAAVTTSPTCGLTGCEVKVEKGGLCTGCPSVNYCSKEHQRRDWPSHKLKCHPVKNPLKAERKADEMEETPEKLSFIQKTSPQAKRHQPSLLITPITSLFQLLQLSSLANFHHKMTFIT